MRFLVILWLGCQNATPPLLTPPPEETTKPSDVVPTTEGVLYTFDFSNRASQYLTVRAVFPVAPNTPLHLAMATWTPGSYLIREYSRNVENLTAQTLEGTPLSPTKISKNQWTIPSADTEFIEISYDLYAHELSVRGNWIEQDFAVLNGAPTFIYDRAHPKRQAFIQPNPPSDWSGVHTALPQKNGRYVAADLDTLIDSPWLMGETKTYAFDIDGVPHKLVNWGEVDVWDGDKSAADVESIVQAEIDFWGHVPYTHYLFLNVIAQRSGGLEHKNSTLMMTNRWNTDKRETYLNWLGLVSHEFFHTWNVKRLRPLALGPFDYETETYTRSLWISEGITSYYDDLILARAGLMNETEYLKKLSKQMMQFQTKPGRKTRSLEDVSMDAWIKHYRKDENSLNTAISYYSKGAVVGWLLDMEIRRSTKGVSSLDDVMRRAAKDFSGPSGFTPLDFQHIAEEICGRELNTFFDAYVRGTTELDYTPALQWLGLQFEVPADNDNVWLGLETSSGHGSARIDSIHKESPAFTANLISGDELLAVNGFRVSSGTLNDRIKTLSKGEDITLLVARRGKVFEVKIKGQQPPRTTWTLKVDGQTDKGSQKRRSHWLNGTRP